MTGLPRSVRRQLIPRAFSRSLSRAEMLTVNPVTPSSTASGPAGAFQTPRVASVRAITPAAAPEGAYAWIVPVVGFGLSRRGK